ncbi:FHA domain-containing protein [Microcoleus sp. LEGE 07076]|uniref:FHA domain-containing protein n=1 Tax=Microcoleus sp. LEGE 07076 TaxID=915322 RepID=UPI0018815BCB|nr:FHA domain-containing protein [Microcoleus sp. LEGE 07076]MBE9186493.1 FHA domain-containing protein [Microcoleus sp. LEGE 07076]
MNPQPLRLRLTWKDTATGDCRSPILDLPIALGRIFEAMPATINGKRVSRIALSSSQISRFHGVIATEGNSIVVTDTGSRNGTFVNGTRQTRCILANGDMLQIGPYAIGISFAVNSAETHSVNSHIFFNPQTNGPDPALGPEMVSPLPQTFSSREFPPIAFLQASRVTMRSLQSMGFPVFEVDWAAVGGGLGSFIWVDLLRICGVKVDRIAVLGMENQPYARYRRLCLNSQIPLRERLRSNSDSCPDNIWGWPPYALRESWQELLKGRLGMSLKLMWQVFAEPTFAETYTPRAGNVFDSIDREILRIGWNQMFRYGRVLAIRKTDDGRYAIAYSRSNANQRNRAFLIAKYVHLATGYPAIQFLPDLQKYREQTQDFKSVVNAYESHDSVYQKLEAKGGSVLIRGRGIVASRVLQRIYEARQQNRDIQVLHLMRSPKPQGNKFNLAVRQVENHYEFQPFNWPKASWGGELRVMLEKVAPEFRPQLLADWGGTTTANRSDWRRIVKEGLSQGWYQITFGEVERVERDSQRRTVTYIQAKELKGQIKLEADFIIDATGLDAKVKTSPFLNDLVVQYNLPLNDLGRLSVDNDFEVPELRNTSASSPEGRVYAAGAITLGGAYAPVDSFLGLQYAALRSVKSLATNRVSGVRKLSVWRSFVQWLKWIFNKSPG